MSATNRGSNRSENDYYPTPTKTILSLLENFKIDYNNLNILDVGAGKGNIGNTIKNIYSYCNITSIEINHDFKKQINSNNIIIDDFLTHKFDEKYDVIIGNPPFKHAQEFIERSLYLVNDCGYVIMLLRTSFLESKKRKEFWKRNKLNCLFTLCERPSFINSRTDACSYSWFIWIKNSSYCEIKSI